MMTWPTLSPWMVSTLALLLGACAGSPRKVAPMHAQLFQPDETQQAEIAEWFRHFDRLSKEADVEGMADQGRFPMYVITDASTGDGVTRVWSRADYVQAMQEAMAHTPKDLEFVTIRTPFMVSPHLVVVLTEWKTKGDASQASQTLKYVDVLVKENNRWKFQTMIQGGWGDFLKH